MAKFRLRNLMGRVRCLDELRIGFLAAFCTHGMNWLARSYLVTKIFPDSVSPYLEGRKNALFAVYHGRVAGLLHIAVPRKQVAILISPSRDGEIISRALSNIGFTIGRGSTSKQAMQGGRQMARFARGGNHLVVTVDGPRGPIYEVKPGIVRMAQMTRLPIIPFVSSARTYTQMWGWDKFMVPHWGGPEVFLYGEPITVPKGASDEEIDGIRTRIDKEMTQLRLLADSFWQQSETQPQRIAT